MFGYVRADNDELKLRELRLYRAYYCGLCRALQKKYGLFAKFLLHYDCTFAAILLSLLKGDIKVSQGRCTFNPLKREPMAECTDEVYYAAAINITLAYGNLLDKWTDDKNILALFCTWIYKGAYKKVRREYPGMVQAAENALSHLSDIEKANCSDIDAAQNASAELLSGVLASYSFEDEVNAHIMKRLFADAGRWIYIADAWQDRERDRKKNSYNPINLSGADREHVMNIMYTALSHMKDAYDLLNIPKGTKAAAIADNILLRGCVNVTESVLKGEYGKTRRRNNGSI